MKVLYIQLGYGGIYSYFDSWVEECFWIIYIEYMFVDKLEVVFLVKIEVFQLDFVFMMVGDCVFYDWLIWLKGKGIFVYVWLIEDLFYIDISFQVIKYVDVILMIE